MLPAITILWCLAALTATWGASLIVRGIAGGRVKGGRYKRSPLAVLIGVAALAGTVAAAWGAFQVASWGGFGDDAAPVRAAAIGLGLAASTMLTIWCIGDRSKGRKRCPKCWYDMAGSSDLRCPECGHNANTHARLARTRRRKAFLVPGLLLALTTAHLFGHARSIANYGWFGAVPTTVLRLGWTWLPEQMIVGDEVTAATGTAPTIDLYGYVWWDGRGTLIERFEDRIWDEDEPDFSRITREITRVMLRDASPRMSLRAAAILRATEDASHWIAQQPGIDRSLAQLGINAATSDDPLRKALAQQILVLLDEPDPDATPISLTDAQIKALIANDRVRFDRSLMFLSWLGDARPSVIPAIIADLEDRPPDPNWSGVASRILGQLFTAFPETLDELTPLLASESALVRSTIARALVFSTPSNGKSTAKVSIEAITGLLDDPFPEINLYAMMIAAQNADHYAILLSEVYDRIAADTSNAAALIPLNWPADTDRFDTAIARFFDFANHPDVEVRQGVISLLSSALQIDDTDRSSGILAGGIAITERLTWDADTHTRSTAHEVLTRMRQRSILVTAEQRDASGSHRLQIDVNNTPVTIALERPHLYNDTNYTILLLPGGLNTDIHWTTPATATTTNNPTRDADTLTAALVNAGYAVLRYGSIPAESDTDVDPANAPPIDFDQSLAIARAALEAFRERHAYHPGKLILLGHSLGATRAAALIADDTTSGRFDIAAFVALSGAYMSNTTESPSRLSTEALTRHASDPITTARDIDDDGTLQGWELALALEDAGEITIASTLPMFQNNVPWPINAIAEVSMPTLALFGSRDPITIHAPRLQSETSKQALANFTVEILPNLGHNLDESDDPARIGPISRQAIDRVINWLNARFARE